MAIAALIVAILALLVAVASAAAAFRSAGAAESTDQQQRTPVLSVTPEEMTSDQAFYVLRNDGPQDLESVIVHETVVGGVVHSVRVPTREDPDCLGWTDRIELGPLKIAATRRFVLMYGDGSYAPAVGHVVRVECRVGKDYWALSLTLPTPPRPVTASVW